MITFAGIRRSLDVTRVQPADIVAMIRSCNRPWTVCELLLIVTRKVFAQAIGLQLINFNPVAGVDLRAILGPRPKKRKRIMLEQGELVRLLAGIDGLIGRENGLMLRLLLVTCVRTNELVTAERPLIDLQRGSWRVRAEATKTRQEFLVPLPPLAVKWMRELMALSNDQVWLCPARRQGSKSGHVSKNVVGSRLRDVFNRQGLDIRRFTPHDLRSTAKGHLRNLGFSREISEIALNHKLPGVEGIYDVREEIPERRAAMEAWAQFIETCCTPPAPAVDQEPAATNVVPFRPRRAA